MILNSLPLLLVMRRTDGIDSTKTIGETKRLGVRINYCFRQPVSRLNFSVQTTVVIVVIKLAQYGKHDFIK